MLLAKGCVQQFLANVYFHLSFCVVEEITAIVAADLILIPITGCASF